MDCDAGLYFKVYALPHQNENAAHFPTIQFISIASYFSGTLAI